MTAICNELLACEEPLPPLRKKSEGKGWLFTGYELLYIKLEITREKGVGNEIRSPFSLLIFEKIGSVGRWETKHFIGMA